MKKTVLLFLGLLLFLAAEDVSAYSRGICSGYGSGYTHVHVSPGRRYDRQSNDLIVLMMLSSTSTTIYCISIADREEDWDRPRRDRSRYSLINYDRLREEGARGRGEYLTALSFYMGCPATATQKFAGSVQRKYSQLFLPPQEFRPDTFMAKLEGIISENPVLRTQCRQVSSGAGRS